MADRSLQTDRHSRGLASRRQRTAIRFILLGLSLFGCIGHARADGPTALQLQATLAAGSTPQSSTSVDTVARQMAAAAGNTALAAVQSTGGDASRSIATAIGGTVSRTLAARAADTVNVADFGAVAGITYLYAPYAMSAGSSTLYTNAARFGANTVGQTIIIPGAGPSGATLVSTIIALDPVNRNTVTIATPATTRIGDPTSLATIAQSPLITVEIGTDNTTAINNAIAFAAAKVTNSASFLLYSSALYFPAGEYLVSSLNLTGIRSYGFHVSGAGAHIHGFGAGNVTVDALGATFLRWDGVEIDGDLFASPRIGLQIGRFGTTADNSAGGHSFDHLSMNGNFTLTGVLDENSETVTWTSLRIYNNAPNAYAFIADGANHFQVSSAFQPTHIPVDSGQSFDENLFLNPVFGTTGVGSTPLWIANAQRLRIVAGYVANTDTTSSTRYAIMLYKVNGTASQQLDLDVHSEAYITAVFGLGGTSGMTSMDMEGLRYRENGTFSSSSIFAIDPGSSLNAITMENVDLDLTTTVTQGIKLLDRPSAYTLSGRLYVPTSMTGMPAQGGFSGTICSGLNCDASTTTTQPSSGGTPQTLAAIAQLATAAMPSAIPVSTQTASTQLTGSSCNSIIRDTGTASHTYTVPTGLPTGCKVDIVQAGAGTVTVAAGTGETIEQAGQNPAHVISAQYGRAVILVDSSSSFVLDGDVK